MSDEKKSIEEILPEEEMKNLDKYPDHMKSPMHGLKDRKEVINETKAKE